MFESISTCQFCQVVQRKPEKNIKTTDSSCKTIFRHTLYQKYSASQNYFYTRDLNQILGGVRTIAYITYNDVNCLDDDDEYLKRYYLTFEFKEKVQILAEFYKFHKDIPRWTIARPIQAILNYFYDKKRRISYYRIQQMIKNDNNNNPDQPVRGIVGQRPYESQFTEPSQNSNNTTNINFNLDNILQEITIQQSISFIAPPKQIAQEQLELYPRKSVVELLSVRTIKNNPKINIDAKVSQVKFNLDLRPVKSHRVVEKIKIINTKKALPITKTYSYSLHAQIIPKIANLTPLSVASPQKKKQNFFKKDSSQSQPTQIQCLNISQAKLKSAHHFQLKQTSHENFVKKKCMLKKSLKLDDVALSNSTKNTVDEKVLQSARYQIFNQYKPQNSKGQHKSTSRDFINQSSKYLANKKLLEMKLKSPVSKILVSLQIVNILQEQIKHQSQPVTTSYYPFNQNKKSVIQLPNEVKKLELKVMQGLQEILNRKHSESFNQQKKWKRQINTKLGELSRQNFY